VQVRTVLTGCWATEQAATARALPGVDLVVENRDKDRLVELVSRSFGGSDAIPVSYVPLQFGPARALVKIEDGCDMRCAFCIIPRTRGPERSRPLAQVVEEVRGLESASHAEIVLTGVQISSYRDGDARLPQLLDAALEATSVCRFRLTSIAPWELTPALLERVTHPRVCRHVHLSLQSGDDRTLRRMRRPYTTERFAELVSALRERVPGIAITTDVIAGFPGETDAEHRASLRFVEAMGFARVHVFSYSPRAGTEAAEMADPVDGETKRARAAAMIATAEAAQQSFHRAHVGGVGRVLWEGRRHEHWLGTTDNYLRVFADSARGDLRGSITEARLVDAAPGGLVAEIL
jgi:threonylcarbamoyladenosine tRNA methylthiotransferase MtaB